MAYLILIFSFLVLPMTFKSMRKKYQALITNIIIALVVIFSILGFGLVFLVWVFVLMILWVFHTKNKEGRSLN